MLIVNSFGLQNALERSAVDIGHFFARCHSSAVACATLMRDEIGPQGYLRFAPDSQYVMVSYAVLSLLKVCLNAVLFYLLFLIFLRSDSCSDPNSRFSLITSRRSLVWSTTWRMCLTRPPQGRYTRPRCTAASSEPLSRRRRSHTKPRRMTHNSPRLRTATVSQDMRRPT